MATKANNPKTLRKSNNANLLWQLYNHGELSRLQLAEKCGLTTASITQLVQSLMLSQVVVETRSVQRNNTGRKEVLLGVNWDKFLALGINIESDNTHISVCSVKEIKEEQIFPTSQLILDGNADELKKKAAEMYAKFNDIKYISIGIAGYVDEENGVSVNSYGILPEGYNLLERMRDLGDEKVEIEIVNNVRAQARSLITEENCDFLYIEHAHGVGCALVADGKLVLGEKNRAGELGHAITEYDGLPCKCGKRGCLETIAAEKRIARAWKEISGQEIDASEIFARYGKDASATKLLDFVADRMAIAVGNTCMIMNPANVLVTGGMFFYRGIYAEFLNRLSERGFNCQNSVRLITDDARIKAFGEAKNVLLKKLFEV